MIHEVIVIGAGPAGISMAAEAVRSGIEREKVVVVEKSEAHSFSIRKFYPEQKLVTANYKGNAAVCRGVMCIDDSSKSETLNYLDRVIADCGIRVRYRESVWKIEKTAEGNFAIGTDKEDYVGKICVIAIGMMGRPNKPDYPIPSQIRKKVHHDITSSPISGEVLVVGGGDSASEYVQYLQQEGCRVALSYRRDSFGRMNAINRESLLALEKQKKVELLLASSVCALSPADGGAVAVTFVQENFAERTFDHVVLALGGSTPKNFLRLLGIEFAGDDPVVGEGFETSVPGLFLIGDLSAGKRGGSIITAFNSSHQAMRKICDDYLQCKI